MAMIDVARKHVESPRKVSACDVHGELKSEYVVLVWLASEAEPVPYDLGRA